MHSFQRLMQWRPWDLDAAIVGKPEVGRMGWSVAPMKLARRDSLLRSAFLITAARATHRAGGPRVASEKARLRQGDGRCGPVC
jgi:hypothetical protein